MTLAEFTRELYTTGVARVSVWQPSPPDQAAKAVVQAHQSAVAAAPARPPPLDQHAARWGLEVLRWSCSILINRTETQTDPPAALMDLQPAGLTAAEHWSVDLGLRYLPDVLRRCRRLATEDPLADTLIAFARQWPLASAGTGAAVHEDRLGTVMEHTCLGLLLVDRVVAAVDTGLAEHPRIQPTLQHELGGYPRIEDWHSARPSSDWQRTDQPE